jgi:nicotianamine synthase
LCFKESNADFEIFYSIDNNPQAIFQSQGLAESLGSLSRGMEFLCKEVGSSYLDLSGFDVVYLAALVGLTQTEKESVLVKVVGGMSVGALVIIRSAHGLRSLLYPVQFLLTERTLSSRYGHQAHEFSANQGRNSMLLLRQF